MTSIETLDFDRDKFVLLRDLLGRIPRVKALEVSLRINFEGAKKDWMRRAKAHLVSPLARESRITEFDQLANSRKKTRECVGLLLYEAAVLYHILYDLSCRKGAQGLEDSQITAVIKKGKKSDLRSSSSVSLTSVPLKVKEQLDLDVISKELEAKKSLRSSQCGITMGKSHWTNTGSLLCLVT